jgi:glycerol-3-phosphate acyltransferase PlsY
VVTALLVLTGFVAGSIPFGVLVARKLGLDIRRHGSGNIGATNVARVLGIVPGVFVLALDALKGAVPVLAAKYAGASPWLLVATGAAAILGHCFSPFLGGKGGKGVATSLGVFFVLTPLLAGVAIVVFGAVVCITRVPALGSLCGAICVSAMLIARGNTPYASLAVATFILMLYTHRQNLKKLTKPRPPTRSTAL